MRGGRKHEKKEGARHATDSISSVRCCVLRAPREGGGKRLHKYLLIFPVEEEENRNVGAVPCSDVLYVQKKQAAVGRVLQTGAGSGGGGFMKRQEYKTHAAQSGP